MKASKKHIYSTAAPTPKPAAPETVAQFLARGGRVESLPAFGVASKETNLTFKDSVDIGHRAGRKKRAAPDLESV